MAAINREKRASRGTRMTELVGDALEEDEAFWGHDIWNEEEGSDMDSYDEEEEEVKPDEFDSDFNDTESDDESGSEEETKLRKSSKASSIKQSKRSNVYKDPSSGKKPAARSKATVASSSPSSPSSAKKGSDPIQSQQSVAKRIRRTTSASSLGSTDSTGTDVLAARAVRESTKAKTIDTDKAQLKEQTRKKAKVNTSSSKADRRKSHTLHDQKQLLLEALDTEEYNNKWLLTQGMVENERTQQEKAAARARAVAGALGGSSFIRYCSRRGAGNTVTFSAVDAMPKVLCRGPPPACPTTTTLCAVTGLPAKYRDPRTGLPYATVEAFKELRRRHEQGKQQQPQQQKQKQKKNRNHNHNHNHNYSEKDHTSMERKAHAQKRRREEG